MKLRDDVSYLIVGGLKGLCGSIALRFARLGARHLTVIGRSGFEDQASQRVIQNIEAEGCKIHVVKGDVTVKEDVKRAFKSAAVPLGGIVQGAMVVRVSSCFDDDRRELITTGQTLPSYDRRRLSCRCRMQGSGDLESP